MKNLFIAIGKVFGYALVYLIVVMLFMAITTFFITEWEGDNEVLNTFFENIFTIISIAIINTVLIVVWESKAARDGWSGIKEGFRGFGIGSLIGISMAVGMLGLTLLFGGGKIEFEASEFSEYLIEVLPLLGIMVVATLGEELLFRGYLLSVLAPVMGRGGANLFMGLLFSIAHWSATGYNTMVSFNILIGSLVVGAVRFSRGGIPGAWGFHFAWNSTQIIAGVTLTGLTFNLPMIQFIGIGSDLVSGGELGPEGSIGAMIATIITLIFIGWYHIKRNQYDLPIPLRFKKEHEVTDIKH